MTLFHIIFFVLLGRLVSELVAQEWIPAFISGVVFIGYLTWLNWILKRSAKDINENLNNNIVIVLICIGIWFLYPLFLDPGIYTSSKNKEELISNEQVNKIPKKITTKSLDKPETKGLFDGMTLEDFLVIANNQIANEPANPDGYANRGLIYFHLKKYRSAFKDLNKSIKMSEYIDEELYLARGLIYLKKSNMTGDIFEKKGCRDIKIAVESDSDYLATKLDEEEISAVRRKCKI